MTTVLFCSPRKNGYTAEVLSQFVKNRDDINLIDIYALSPAPCTACEKCRTDYKCVNSDMDSVLNDIENSDFLIVATPVYNYSVPAPMKAFLDRLQPLYERSSTKINEHKRAFLIVTCAQSGKYSFDIIRKQMSLAFKELGFSFSGELNVGFTDKNDAGDSDLKKAETLSYKFFGGEEICSDI